MKADKSKQLKSFERLLHIMDDLREKCPWDRKQTMESLRHLTIEEVYELGDAILDKDDEAIKEEIGDVLLHLVFYSKIASETNTFDFSDVAERICNKLVDRHPHIYGDDKVENEEDVKKNWEALKLKEGKKSVLEGVPRSLPALVKASRIQEKVAGVGFDWDTPDQVFEKVKEELDEFSAEIDKANQDKMEAEFGDVLFSMINYARFLGINPENALERTNKKFMKRFQYLEQEVEAQKLSLKQMKLAEMDEIWEKAKKND
ncbi:MAG: nucleoside triphosphate pyrophosphohydrolase [Psychroflexus halocasei]